MTKPGLRRTLPIFSLIGPLPQASAQQRGGRCLCRPSAGTETGRYLRLRSSLPRASRASPLNGRPVAVLGDNDDAGQKHQRDVANRLHSKAREVKVIELPGLGPKQDVSDWLDAGHTLKELISLVWDTPAYKPDPTQGPTNDDAGDANDDRKPHESSKRTQSSELVDLCDTSGVELFHEPGIGGDAYAVIADGRHRETYR